MTNLGPIALDVDPIHLAGDGTSARIEGFGFDPPSFEAYMRDHCNPADPGRLAMIEHSETEWGMWECHTGGDELVVVLSGIARFIQQVDGEERPTVVPAGKAIVNPAGVWHTADVIEPFSALYLTPCPGTEHRPRQT